MPAWAPWGLADAFEPLATQGASGVASAGRTAGAKPRASNRR
jgi:hypothetical protein